MSQEAALEYEVLRLKTELESEKTAVRALKGRLDAQELKISDLMKENREHVKVRVKLSEALHKSSQRADALSQAIRRHHADTTEHQMCWENDQELWRAVGIESDRPEPPEWCEFITRCAEYRASREGETPTVEEGTATGDDVTLPDAPALPDIPTLPVVEVEAALAKRPTMVIDDSPLCKECGGIGVIDRKCGPGYIKECFHICNPCMGTGEDLTLWKES